MTKKFNPKGTGYDYKNAGKPDKSGHYGSLDPRTGMVLKGMKHKTIGKTHKAEIKRGNIIIENVNDGRFYSKNLVNLLQKNIKGVKK